ncbi:MAG: hypothetical protein U9O54_03490, partial [Chloroflexota bacterium]|nr:hypothetical protein [Chloroflexota bacterium]
MTETKKTPLNNLTLFAQNRVVPVIVFIYLIIAALIFLVVPVFAYNWVNTPFLGAFVEHSQVFVGTGPERPDVWNKLKLSETPHTHQLIMVDDHKISNVWELPQILREYEIGDTVELTTLSSAGDENHLEIKLQSFPRQAIRAFLYIPYGVGLLYLVSAIWVYIQRRSFEEGRSFVVFSSSIAIITATLFDLYTTHYLTHFWYFALV